MPFGLTNAPAVFQRFINDILRGFNLDKFGFAYLVISLVIQKNVGEHFVHVKAVLELLIKNELYCKASNICVSYYES
jgi:hypothetical protein